MKNRNQFRMLIAVLTLGVLSVLAVPKAQAQERFRTLVLTNTVFPTAYAPQGGTNSYAITNSSLYSVSGAKTFSLRDLQNSPVWWDMALTAANAGTSNTIAGLDLSIDDDGTYWASNAVTATLAQTGTGTNVGRAYFPLTNGTNVFSGYRLGRWSYASTTQTNGVKFLKNQLTTFR